MDYDILMNGLYSGGGQQEVVSKNSDFQPENEPKDSGSTDTNINFMIPDFFLNNVDYGMFIVLLYVIIILISSKIQNLYIRFISLAIISLIISSSYGISMSIIFFIVTIDEKPDPVSSVMYIILILLSLFHIFIPVFTTKLNISYGNYIYEIIIFTLTMVVIWYNSSGMYNRRLVCKKQEEEKESNLSRLLSSKLYDDSSLVLDSKELYFDDE